MSDLADDLVRGALRAPSQRHGATAEMRQRIAEYAQRIADEAPPLTSEQRDRLAVILRQGVKR